MTVRRRRRRTRPHIAVKAVVKPKGRAQALGGRGKARAHVPLAAAGGLRARHGRKGHFVRSQPRINRGATEANVQSDANDERSQASSVTSPTNGDCPSPNSRSINTRRLRHPRPAMYRVPPHRARFCCTPSRTGPWTPGDAGRYRAPRRWAAHARRRCHKRARRKALKAAYAPRRPRYTTASSASG